MNQTNLNNALLEASTFGDLEKVKYFLSFGADINAVDSDGCTPALRAAVKGRRELYDYLASQKGFKNVLDNYGNDAAILAVISGNTEMYDHLIDNYGFDPQATDSIGWNALAKASSGNDNTLNMAKHLMSKYPFELNKRNHYNSTAKNRAISFGNTELVNFFEKVEKLHQELSEVLQRSDYENLQQKFNEIKRICDAGAMPQSFKESLTKIAASEGNLELYDYLVSQHGFKVRVDDVLSAIETGRDRFVVDVVSKYKVNVDLAPEGKLSISQSLKTNGFARDFIEQISQANHRLIEQAKNGASFEELSSTIESGAQIDSVDSDGCNVALIAANLGGNISLYDSLINKYPELKSSKDIFGNDALILAVVSGNVQMCDHLLDTHNFDPTLTNKFGYDAFKMAALENDVKMVDHFLTRYPEYLFHYTGTNMTSNGFDRDDGFVKELQDNKCDKVFFSLLLKTEKTLKLLDADSPDEIKELCEQGALPQAYDSAYVFSDPRVQSLYDVFANLVEDQNLNNVNLSLKDLLILENGNPDIYFHLVNTYEEFKIGAFDLFLSLMEDRNHLAETILENYERSAILPRDLIIAGAVARNRGSEAIDRKIQSILIKSFYTDDELIDCITDVSKLRSLRHRDDPTIYYSFQRPTDDFWSTSGVLNEEEQTLFNDAIISESSDIIAPFQEIKLTTKQLANINEISETKRIIFVTKGRPMGCGISGVGEGAAAATIEDENIPYSVIVFNKINLPTIAHELGHTLLLKHPDKYSFKDQEPFCNKATETGTEMSYDGVDEMGFKSADIKAINRILEEHNPELRDTCVKKPELRYYESYKTQKDPVVESNPQTKINPDISEAMTSKHPTNEQLIFNISTATLMAFAFAAVVKKLLRPNAKTEVRESSTLSKEENKSCLIS